MVAGMVAVEWQGRQDSNPRPAVLETAALPIEPLTYYLVSLNTTCLRATGSYFFHSTLFG